MLITHRTHIIILSVIAFIVLALVTLVVTSDKYDNKILLGDNVAVFNKVDDNGNDLKSVLAIYDADFKRPKMLIDLDEIYYFVDQINFQQGDGASQNVVFRVYNDESYQDVTINLQNDTVSKSKVTKSVYEGDDKTQLNIYSNGDFELSKPDFYKVIEDPKLRIDSKYYTLSDFTQITNYVK